MTPENKIESEALETQNTANTASDVPGAPEIAQNQSVPLTQYPKPKPRIFVIHGHDEIIKNKIVNFLNQIGIEAIALRDPDHVNMALVQKNSEYADVAFAVVTLSADQFVYAKHEKPSDALLQSNQGTVFEMGYWIGKLGRDRVFALYNEQKMYRTPSKFFDALYCPMDEDGHWQKELTKRLENCHYPINRTQAK